MTWKWYQVRMRASATVRAPYYAIMKRIQFRRGFFERAWAMQPKCMALFGHEAEGIFMLSLLKNEFGRDKQELAASTKLTRPDAHSDDADRRRAGRR
jgi:hypothetical protein